MGDPQILNKDRLPINYQITDLDIIRNPFFERFGKFDDPFMEFVDICMNNLTFAVYNLMKWKGKPMELAPFQSVILDTLWHKTFPILLMTRGGGKSFMLAVYALLRAILVQGSKVVIVAASFRQSKVVFDYILKIHDGSPLIQAAVDKIKKENDSWEMVIGDSTIKALPLGNGEKIRGIRATDIICDEYASIPEEIFQVVVRGFAAVAADPIEAAKIIAMEDEKIRRGEMKEEDRRRIIGNKIIYSGTASYRFNHYYKLYEVHKRILDAKFVGDAQLLNKDFNSADENAIKLEGKIDYRDYAIIQIPYTGIPKGFMDEKQINQALATMPRALFSMEYECMFPNDSDGFFKRSAINAATPGVDNPQMPFGVELAGDSNYEYVMGIDPARKTDNFAISIVKIMGDGTFRNVYCDSMRNKNWVEAVRRVRDLMRKFNIVRIAVDSGGGGTTVEDLLQTMVGHGEPAIWRYNDDEHIKFEGLHILDMINFTPSWIAEANYGLASDIEHKKLLFPHRTMEVDIDETTDPIWDEIDAQINEMCMIVVTATKTGIQHFDLPEIQGEGQIASVQRKDRYSALLLATYAARTYTVEGIRTVLPETGGWADHLW